MGQAAAPPLRASALGGLVCLHSRLAGQGTVFWIRFVRRGRAPWTDTLDRCPELAVGAKNKRKLPRQQDAPCINSVKGIGMYCWGVTEDSEALSLHYALSHVATSM